MNFHVGKRRSVATVLGALAVLGVGLVLAFGVRSVVADPDSGPAGAPPNPGHSWSEIGDLPGTMWHSNNDGEYSGLDADTVDGLHASEIGGGGGLTLPYDGTTSSTDPAFSITNSGTGMGIRGLSTDTGGGITYGGYFEAYSEQGRAVAGATDGAEGRGVFGYAMGSNGVGVYGESDQGTGVDGRTYSDNEWVPAIYGRNEGNGDGLYGWSQNRHGTVGVTHSSDPEDAGVWASNDGPGPAIKAEGDGHFTGRVGIGTTNPSDETKVHVEAASDDFGVLVDALGTAGSEIGLHTSTGGFASLAKNAYYSFGWQRFSEALGAFLQEITPSGDVTFYVAEAAANPISWEKALTLKADGDVGMGTTTPDARLHVVANTGYGDGGVRGDASAEDGMGVSGRATGPYGTGVSGVATGSAGNGVRAYSAAGTALWATVDADYATALWAESGGPNGWAADFQGNVRITNWATGDPVITLGEGLDYGEGFDVSDEAGIGPGTVLVIDAENPGELAISEQAYDPKVAGIVSGANGLDSAVQLGGDQFDFTVALAGRVYCNVDASYGEVSPGDLLTTSPTPGYAMVVKDYSKAQGAILGKAMEELEEGEQGQILVLVTLQ